MLLPKADEALQPVLIKLFVYNLSKSSLNVNEIPIRPKSDDRLFDACALNLLPHAHIFSNLLSEGYKEPRDTAQRGTWWSLIIQSDHFFCSQGFDSFRHDFCTGLFRFLYTGMCSYRKPLKGSRLGKTLDQYFLCEKYEWGAREREVTAFWNCR